MERHGKHQSVGFCFQNQSLIRSLLVMTKSLKRMLAHIRNACKLCMPRGRQNLKITRTQRWKYVQASWSPSAFLLTSHVIQALAWHSHVLVLVVLPAPALFCEHWGDRFYATKGCVTSKLRKRYVHLQLCYVSIYWTDKSHRVISLGNLVSLLMSCFLH